MAWWHLHLTGLWQKWWWPIRVTVRHLLGGTEEYHENPKSCSGGSWPNFEPTPLQYKSREFLVSHPPAVALFDLLIVIGYNSVRSAKRKIWLGNVWNYRFLFQGNIPAFVLSGTLSGKSVVRLGLFKLLESPIKFISARIIFVIYM